MSIGTLVLVARLTSIVDTILSCVRPSSLFETLLEGFEEVDFADLLSISVKVKLAAQFASPRPSSPGSESGLVLLVLDTYPSAGVV